MRSGTPSSVPAAFRAGYCPWQYMLSLSADARLAAIAPATKDYPNEWDGTIRVWDLTAGKELWSFPFVSKGYGTGHAFTPDGKRLITSTEKCYFQVWDLASGKETAPRSPAEGGQRIGLVASAVAVSPDGKRFATGRRDGRVDLWDTATGKALVPFATHRDVIDGVAVSPDGRLAATLCYDESIRVWELATGRPGCVIAAPLGPEAPVRYSFKLRPVFTPDGRGLLFTAKGELALADPATGKWLDLSGSSRPEGNRRRVHRGWKDNSYLYQGCRHPLRLAGRHGRVTVAVPLGPEMPGPRERRMARRS